MDKPVNNRAWFLVLPVLVLVGSPVASSPWTGCGPALVSRAWKVA